MEWYQVMAIVGANAQEMKDFHGKLEKQDTEFKAHMRLTDERFKNIGG